jgi:hypothetical protein
MFKRMHSICPAPFPAQGLQASKKPSACLLKSYTVQVNMLACVMQPTKQQKTTRQPVY